MADSSLSLGPGQLQYALSLAADLRKRGEVYSAGLVESLVAAVTPRSDVVTAELPGEHRDGWQATPIGIPVCMADPPRIVDYILATVYSRVDGNRLLQWTTVRPACFGAPTAEEAVTAGKPPDSFPAAAGVPSAA